MLKEYMEVTGQGTRPDRTGGRASHSERVEKLVRESLESVGYRTSGGLVVAPKKVCLLVTDLANRFVTLLDEVDLAGK
jgi:hypothetical protein